MLVQMSISGGVLILLILLLRSLAGKRLPKRLFSCLWSIALLRLLLPFSLPLPAGIATPVTDTVLKNVETAPMLRNREASKMAGGIASAGSSFSPDWTEVLWLVGFLGLLMFFGILYYRESQKLRTALPLSPEAASRFKALLPLNVPGRFFVSDRIASPLTFGVFAPKILLPRFFDFKDTSSLKYVLTHEAIHIKYADNLAKLLLLAALSLHWFNPLVWVMYLFFNRDMELACDEKVLLLLGEDSRAAYAATLVSLAEKQYKWALFSNSFGKNAVKERIVMIMKFKKVTGTALVCSLLLAGLAVTVFAKPSVQAEDFVSPAVSSSGFAQESAVSQLNADTEITNIQENSSTQTLETDDTEASEMLNADPAETDTDELYNTLYGSYGLEYQAPDALYYKGERVEYFLDNKSQDSDAFSGTFWYDQKGTVSVKAVRNASGNLTGLEKLSEKELRQLEKGNTSGGFEADFAISE